MPVAGFAGGEGPEEPVPAQPGVYLLVLHVVLLIVVLAELVAGCRPVEPQHHCGQQQTERVRRR